MFVLTPQDVEAGARSAAGWLRRRGVRRGERVAVVSPNRPDLLSLTMGALRSGIVPVLLNASLAEGELAWLIEDCEPALVVRAGDWPRVDAPPDDLARVPLGRAMHYTSGTTGRSKGIWGGVLTESEAASLAADEADLWGARAGDTFLVCSPLYHSAPHRSALSALLNGARVIVFESFDAAAVVRAFGDEGVTGAFLVPTQLRRLLASGIRPAAARRVLHAGEPCPEPLKRAALQVFPPDSLFEFYGSTEGQFSVISPGEWSTRPGSLGRARAGRELSIRGARDAEGVGTIYVTAPVGWRWQYWRDPQKTASAWQGDAFTVGDLGRIDDDGYLYLAGRREDLIISGGVNVYPSEVERVLAGHPGVREVAVFGTPDPDWGQRVCAAIVGDVEPESCRRWAREHLPGSHAPKEVHVVSELPRTPTGKVRRDVLRGLLR